MAPPFVPLSERFWRKVEIGTPDECWLWQGNVRNGYGAIRMPGAQAGSQGAHRVAWLLTYGEIPQGAHILHRCDVRRCVNPSHLFVGDNDTNVADKVSKRRSCVGEKNGAAKLTEQLVLEIRRRVQSGESMRSLARELQVDRMTVRKIVRRDTWKHL